MTRSQEYYDYIYSNVWYYKSNLCRQALNGRCTLFPFLKAHDAHHLNYKHFKSEWLIRDIVPLSRIAHGVVHWKIFWKTKLRFLINLILRSLFIFWWVIFLPIRIIKHGHH